MVPGVEKVTRTRGSRDTRPLGHVIALLASILLHVLPFPVYLFGGMIGWFGPPPAELPDHETIIPVDLMLTEGEEAPPPGVTAKPPAPAVPTLEEPPAALPTAQHAPPDAGPRDTVDAAVDAAVDAGTDASPDVVADADRDGPADAGPSDAAPAPDASHDAAVAATDAGPGDASPTDAAPRLTDAAVAKTKQPDAALPETRPDAAVAATDAGVGGPDGGAGPKPYRPIRDPVGLAGEAKSITPKNPNVSLVIYLDRIRQHPLGQRFAPSLTKLKNWQNFFGGTGLEPVRDIDRILLAGPQLRDSSRVVTVIRYNVAPARVRSALDALVKRPKSQGQWVPKRVPVAKAHVDGADRYFVMIAPSMLVVVPPDGLDQALALPRNVRFPSAGNDAVVLFLKYPANAFRDQPLRLPTSVEWMRFSMSLNPSGGADARLDAKDKDAATAAENAPKLTEVINKAMEIDLLFTKRRLLDPVTFRAEGDHIRAETHVTDAQLRHILSFIAAKIDQVDDQGAQPAK